MHLILVESPTKAKTLKKFLDKKYQITSTKGHIRDLPKSGLGVDTEKNFEPKYIIPTKKRKKFNSLKKEVEKADKIILATDEDREGEAISWHLKEGLNLDSYERITFHEITKEAILEAIKNPRKIDINLVDAQQARRILDRLVGYKLSPFLWKKIAKGLSAGRVQSVALKLIVDREEEIAKFVPEEYWKITAKFKNDFEALLIKKDSKKIEIKSEEETEKVLEELKEAKYKVKSIKKKERKRNPLPPFKTSTLQQEAWKRLRFPSRFTMSIAQNLYEKGFITYHRTDSLNLSQSSMEKVKSLIIKEYGKNYYNQRRYKSKGKTQEAHEAIRPVSLGKKPPTKETHLKLYDLIKKRFIASQMASAVFDSTQINIEAKNYTFRASGQVIKFQGFLKVYPIKFKEEEIPLLKEKEELDLLKLDPSQHFTNPPPRYTEASLIKILEKEGIGRPSTYAPIISNIEGKNYIEKNDNKYFKPTEIGTLITNLLSEHFPKIMDIKFTAKMEEDLDEIAEGKTEWQKVCKNFYAPFEEKLQKKYDEVKKIVETTNKKCPKCKKPLIIKWGRFGKFYACSGFPECKYTDSLEKKTLGIKCPQCKEGEITEKRTKKNKIFYGCNNFPKCDFALWDKPYKEEGKVKKCEKCNSFMVEKNKKVKCSNKECKN